MGIVSLCLIFKNNCLGQSQIHYIVFSSLCFLLRVMRFCFSQFSSTAHLGFVFPMTAVVLVPHIQQGTIPVPCACRQSRLCPSKYFFVCSSCLFLIFLIHFHTCFIMSSFLCYILLSGLNPLSTFFFKIVPRLCLLLFHIQLRIIPCKFFTWLRACIKFID